MRRVHKLDDNSQGDQLNNSSGNLLMSASNNDLASVSSMTGSFTAINNNNTTTTTFAAAMTTSMINTPLSDQSSNANDQQR